MSSMRTEDATEFFALLDDAWSLKGQSQTAGQKTLFFAALSAYTLAEVKAGLMAHIRNPKRGAFLPMPADVIAQIQGAVADDGRPGPEEAWAQVYRGMDEMVTLCWCEEMSKAFGVARPLLAAGDEVAARMAFREAYTRMVDDARQRRVPARWSATLGTDAAGRNAALLPHVQAGRLSAGELSMPRLGVDEVLALPAPPDASDDNLKARAAAMDRMRTLRDEIAARKNDPTATELAAVATRGHATALKAATDAAVRSRLATPAANQSNLESKAS
jgi:hypothetical protein